MNKGISKILGIGLSAGLIFGLIGALFAAPVSADLMEWGIVNTPSWEDGVILPASNIIDYDISGDDGSVVYAVLEVDSSCSDFLSTEAKNLGYALLKSEDSGVTWSDITANVTNASNLPGSGFSILAYVAVAPDDEDWVAVVGYGVSLSDPMVVASKDGGDNFVYAGDMVDTSNSTELIWAYGIDVSPETDTGIHIIAVWGYNDVNADVSGYGCVYRLDAGTWLTGSWEDTSFYDGWDGDPNGNVGGNDTLDSYAVIDGEFSPNFDVDFTFVCIGTANPGGAYGYGLPYVQTGDLDSKQWGTEAGMPDPVQIKSDGDQLQTDEGIWWMGIALPADYDGSDPGTRAVFLYVNAYNAVTDLWGGWVFRLDNTDLSPDVAPSGNPFLASIDIHGDADTGKMMVGKYADFDQDGPLSINDPDPCAGVNVWHTAELDICCVKWEAACKDPSGPFIARVMYTPDGAREYATTTGNDLGLAYQNIDIPGSFTGWGDESAFSVSRDDAVSFNQIGLIDTNIDYLSDVAVCPDCSTIYLSSVQTELFQSPPCSLGPDWEFLCDSVWRSYDDGDTWERVFHGDWSDSQLDPLLLRLPCDAIEDCCDQDPVSPSGTIYLGIQGTNDIFYSRDCGQCWNDPQATKIEIQDFAVESENIVYVIDDEGMFSMSTQYGRRWSDAVDTGLDSGHTIASCCNEGFVVVGGNGDEEVAWSDDGGDSWNLTDALPGQSSQKVHVACDPICDNIIYAALCSAISMGGIYRTDITDGSWDDLNAEKFPYYGIVVAREGTLYAVSSQIGVDEAKDLCDEGRFTASSFDLLYSGVARNLTPCETACCGTEDWDYLICGLEQQTFSGEYFNAEPSALRICGCLSIDTNSVLWTIDFEEYDVTDGSDGSLWSYEDCAAKMGPTLTSPADGSVLDCEPCAGCDAANFTLKWERMCEACSYDVQIMDEDGNLIVEWVDEDITGDPPTLFVDGTMDGADGDYYLDCGMTYTWHVREANTSCECVHSPWSDTWTFTVTVGAADAIQLLAPEKGAMGVPIQNIGFSWTSVRNASSYSFVLSPNANLTGALVSQNMSTTAFNYVGPLDYSKAYYWQIIAWQDGTRLTTSSIGVFNTMAEPVAPTPPVVVEQQPAPVINIPPAEKITPTWIYAIIGIGAALAVVVIVLIVRTRRP
jgi:hypothetical protein